MRCILFCSGVKIWFSFSRNFLTQCYQRLFADSDTIKNLLCWNPKTHQDSWGFVAELKQKSCFSTQVRHPGYDANPGMPLLFQMYFNPQKLIPDFTKDGQCNRRLNPCVRELGLWLAMLSVPWPIKKIKHFQSSKSWLKMPWAISPSTWPQQWHISLLGQTAVFPTMAPKACLLNYFWLCQWFLRAAAGVVWLQSTVQCRAAKSSNVCLRCPSKEGICQLASLH